MFANEELSGVWLWTESVSVCGQSQEKAAKTQQQFWILQRRGTTRSQTCCTGGPSLPSDLHRKEAEERPDDIFTRSNDDCRGQTGFIHLYANKDSGIWQLLKNAVVAKKTPLELCKFNKTPKADL